MPTELNAEQTNDPKAYHDPGAVTPEELAAHDAAQQKAREAENKKADAAAQKKATAAAQKEAEAIATQAAKEAKKKEAEGGPADTGADKGDGSLEPAFETNTPSKAPRSDFRQKLYDVIEGEIDIIKAALGAGRGAGTEKQQDNLFKLLELGVKLSNDDEI